MMKPKYILLFVLLVNLTGCVAIVKWKYGITNPKAQDPRMLLSFLVKNKYPVSNQYFFIDSSCYFQEFRDTCFRENLFSHMIFDAAGSLIQRDSTECQWSGYEVIKTLDPANAYQKAGSLRIEGILDHITPLNPGPGPCIQHPDFTIVVTWARFIGKLNKKLFDLSDAAGGNKTARIRLIWLNVDMQKNWKLTKAQKLEIR
jgi:hypothetical protein